VVVVGTTARGPEAQAKLWCRSRSMHDVDRARKLIFKRAPKLAAMLKDEWACFGPQATIHLPGQSWHQWGEAADVCAIVGGRAIWDGAVTKKIAEKCAAIGLRHSLLEKSWYGSYRHWHVQLSKEETPLMVRGLADSWAMVEEEMEKRFDI
jgi:hypothetical protein